MMEFILQCIDYLKANPTLMYVLFGVAGLAVLLLLIGIIRSIKRAGVKRQAKREAKKAAALEQRRIAEQQKAEEKKKKEEESARARAELLAKLEEQEKAAAREKEEQLQKEQAEKEQAEALVKAAAEEQAAREKVEAEERAAREKAEAEERAAREKAEAEERAAREKAEAEERAAQEKAEAEAIAKAEAEEEAEQAAIAQAIAEKTANEQAKLDQEKAQQAEKAAAMEKAEAEAIAKAEAEEEAHLNAIEKAIAEKTAKEMEQKAKAQAKKQTVTAAAVKEKNAKPAAKPATKTANKPANAGTTRSIKPTQKAQTPAIDPKTGKKYSGKWSIFRVVVDGEDTQEDMYFFELRASNGEKLLSSEEYTSHAGALKGIQTHKANIEKGNFKITISKKGDYIFKLLSGKNMLLCMGENYPTLARCESAIASTKRFAKSAVIDETLYTRTIKVVPDDDGEIPPVPDGHNGKWIISSSQDLNGQTVYFFELFANNGEKLIASEEYTTYIGAVNGIQTHKTNIEKGNFRISLTKRGDYIYKLLNGNGQLLSLGEHYKSKRLCQNAVESVRRFALNSPVLTDISTVK